PSSYRCTFTFSPFAPRSLLASLLLRAVRLPRPRGIAGLPGSSTHLSPRAASNYPGEPNGCFIRSSTTGVRLHPLRQTGHSQSLTRLNRVRLRCGSRVRLARLRDGDCSHSTRLRGYVDERIISPVNSFQFTR